MEEWKIIPIAPCYEASSLGRVRNRNSGAVLSPSLRKDGYYQVGLREGQPKRLFRKISQLVGEAFLGVRPFEKAVVAHKDGSRDNDKPENLYWTTQKQNHADRETHGRTARGSRQGVSKLTESQVSRIKELLKTGVLTQLDLANMFGVCTGTISNINTGKNWTHV